MPADLVFEVRVYFRIYWMENVMKAMILAGGLGTRISEETDLKPKPMVEIGGKPILWHIMKSYSEYGISDFLILTGYKGSVIKDYFANYFLYQSDVTFDLKTNSMEVHNNKSESWRVTLIDTGINAMTGARIKRAKQYVGDETFLLTYGDGVADLNISETIDFHKKHGGVLTMTSAQPAGRFGALVIDEDNKVMEFNEKPKGDGSWINAGYYVCDPKLFDYISDSEDEVFEENPISKLTSANQLYSYKHRGFFMPMDTLRDKKILSELWDQGTAPWCVWDR